LNLFAIARLGPNMSQSVLIVGGGFAGLEAAIMARRAGLETTLVSDRPEIYIYPLSIWVPTGERTGDEITLDLRDLARRHGFTFVEGAVTALSAARRSATVAGEELTADHLVVAIGGKQMRPKGVEHTHALGGDPQNAVRLKAALDALIARGSGKIAMGFGGNPKDGSAVRGGPIFELLFNVEVMLRKKGVRDRFTLDFYAPMPNPGERMGKRAAAAARDMLTARGIGVHTGKKITGFEQGAVLFEDASKLEADLVVFLPAGEGHPVIRASDLPKNEAGFVTTDEGCAVPGFEGVWAIGDSAALLGPDFRAKQGHLAEVMARVVAANIAAAGKAERESYVPHVGITCLMDMGDGGAFVQHDATHERLVPLPVVGHWMKEGWGAYFKASKRRQVPRLPGM
jgi:sulfide:quinone oxidoreductase